MEQPADVSTPSLSLLSGEDVARLRRDAPNDNVLVRSKGKPFIRVGEYNAWLGSYPLDVTGEDRARARRQALEQMVAFKLIIEKAREAGYGDKLKSGLAPPDEKSLALAYIKDQVTSISSVTDEEASEYASRHPDKFAELAVADIPAEVRMMAVKGSVRGEQFARQVQAWAEQAGIAYETESP